MYMLKHCEYLPSESIWRSISRDFKIQLQLTISECNRTSDVRVCVCVCMWQVSWMPSISIQYQKNLFKYFCMFPDNTRTHLWSICLPISDCLRNFLSIHLSFGRLTKRFVLVSRMTIGLALTTISQWRILNMPFSIYLHAHFVE